MYGLIRQTLSDRMSTVNGDCLEFRRLIYGIVILLGALHLTISSTLNFLGFFLLPYLAYALLNVKLF